VNVCRSSSCETSCAGPFARVHDLTRRRHRLPGLGHHSLSGPDLLPVRPADRRPSPSRRSPSGRIGRPALRCRRAHRRAKTLADRDHRGTDHAPALPHRGLHRSNIRWRRPQVLRLTTNAASLGMPDRTPDRGGEDLMTAVTASHIPTLIARLGRRCGIPCRFSIKPTRLARSGQASEGGCPSLVVARSRRECSWASSTANRILPSRVSLPLLIAAVGARRGSAAGHSKASATESEKCPRQRSQGNAHRATQGRPRAIIAGRCDTAMTWVSARPGRRTLEFGWRGRGRPSTTCTSGS
jgi:hypothetical protein